MRIRRLDSRRLDCEEYELSPVSEEDSMLYNAIAKLEHGSIIYYLGRHDDDEFMDEWFVVVVLNVGGKRDEECRMVGGENFKLRGTTREDKYKVNQIRNRCFARTEGELVFQVTEEGESVLLQAKTKFYYV